MGNSILIDDSCGAFGLSLSVVIVPLLQIQKHTQIKTKKSLQNLK